MAFDGSHGDYFGHGQPFHDMFAAAEVAATLTGHGLSVADAATLAAIASEVAQSHDGPEPHGFQTDYAQTAPAHAASGWHAGEDGFRASLDQQFSPRGIARDATRVEVLHWPHGCCDPQAQIRWLAEEAGMVLFRPWENGGIAEVDKTEKCIFPLAQRLKPAQTTRGWSPGKPAVMPHGWYENATGWTHVWGECFRSQPPFFGSDNFEKRRTFLIVVGGLGITTK